MLRYLFNFLGYLVIAFMVWSIGAVIVYKFVPVTVTPLKVWRVIDNFDQAKLSFSSKWCSIDDMSPEMVKAVMAAEDSRFAEHNGFDFEELKKAIKENKTRKKARGASTISQQTAKNVFCIPSNTWVRKGFEAWFTILIEQVWGKKRIMEVYLNIMETGVNIYGAEGAARQFYDKSAADLNRHEASMIAAVLPNPRFRTISNPSRYMVRRAGNIRSRMRNVEPLTFLENDKK